MEDIREFMKRASERSGFQREFYVEKNLPTTPNNIVVLPFFGDIEGHSILSAFLLRMYKERAKSSKYFILCSWPGFKHLYPYVDEYWSINDMTIIKQFAQSAKVMENNSDLATVYTRNLNQYFENVIPTTEIAKYYNRGFQPSFWETFKEVTRFLPSIYSVNVADPNISRQLADLKSKTVFLSPFVNAKSWRRGKLENIAIKKDFWVELIEYLHNNGIVPIVWQNHFSHNVSTEVVNKSIIFAENDLAVVLAVIRGVGCTLDIFGGLSRLSLVARTPYLACEERDRMSNCKCFEIDDLSSLQIPKEYIFSFTHMIEGGNWEPNLFMSIKNKLENFLPDLNRDTWPATSETFKIVSYERVQNRKAKKLGFKFIKIPKD